MNVVIDGVIVDGFRRDGLAVLREAIDPRRLAAEVDDALAHGMRVDAAVNRGGGGVGFQCVIGVYDLAERQRAAGRARQP